MRVGGAELVVGHDWQTRVQEMGEKRAFSTPAGPPQRESASSRGMNAGKRRPRFPQIRDLSGYFTAHSL